MDIVPNKALLTENLLGWPLVVYHAPLHFKGGIQHGLGCQAVPYGRIKKEARNVMPTHRKSSLKVNKFS